MCEKNIACILDLKYLNSSNDVYIYAIKPSFNRSDFILYFVSQLFSIKISFIYGKKM